MAHSLEELDHRVKVLEFWNSWSWSFVKSGAILILFSHLWALNAPLAEASMGETGRILYVHVPTAWIAMIIYVWAFWCACAVLWNMPKPPRSNARANTPVISFPMLLFTSSPPE